MAKRKKFSVWVIVQRTDDDGTVQTVNNKMVEDFHSESVANAASTCLVSYYDRELKPRIKNK